MEKNAIRNNKNTNNYKWKYEITSTIICNEPKQKRFKKNEYNI